MSVKLSVTSKLDGIKSWSLEALETCPGSVNKDGSLVPACSGCYATTGNYRFSNVKAPRAFNKEDWKRDAWEDEMVQALQDSRYFRWFDSGDLYDLRLAEKVYQVMNRTPWVSHWMPTRMHKFAKFQSILERMNSLSNVVVRFSSDSVLGEIVQGATYSSIIVPDQEKLPKGATMCNAYENEGKCSGCRACYSKDVALVAYLAHGKKMSKVIRLALAA